MKNMFNSLSLSITALAIGSLLMVGCEDPNQSRAESEFAEYRDFVDNESGIFENEDDWDWEEYDQNWREYDSSYQEHLSGVEQNREYLSEKDKAEFDSMQSEYEDRRNRYEERASNENSNIEENSISGRMYASVDISNPSNIDLSNVSASNLRASYKSFVDYVNDNKTQMTAQDWRNAEKIWEAMNLRKNEVEENISTEDNLAIGTIKAEYGALKSSYGLLENVKDTSGSKEDLGDVTDKMEDRNKNPKN